MIQLRHQQPTLWAGFFADEVDDLWEPWMRAADKLLEDEELLSGIYEAQGKRHERSRTFGRPQTPAEVVLRMLLLKHVRNWSFEDLEREVRANLVYRSFCRIGTEKVPDAKTLGGLARALGSEVVQQLHARLVQLAIEKRVVQGRKMRVDTTVVETNIHYPTDSTLLGDGTRVLTRTMKQIERGSGGLKRRVRDRMRSVKKRVLAIALASRQKGPQGEERRKKHYRELLTVSRRVVNQARRVLEEVKHRRRTDLKKLREQLAAMTGRVRQVIRQTRARVFGGDTKTPGKIVSVFEPHTEIIRKGKASKPTEFGKMVKIQEAENQIITDYQVFEERPNDSDLLVPTVIRHEECFGRTPHLAATDAAFFSAANETKLQERGVKRIAVPNRNTKSEARRRMEKSRWFRNGQRWRTGCEGRISVLKRRHGLRRCLYRGMDGMRRWVGLGVIADNMIHIGELLSVQCG